MVKLGIIMRFKKMCVLLMVIMLQLLAIISVSQATISIRDDGGLDDVYHMTVTDNKTIVESSSERPEIDIYKISYRFTEENAIKLSVSINGFINTTRNIKYVLWYNTTNASYLVNFSKGINNGYVKALDTGELYSEIENITISVDKHTLTATYGIYGIDRSVDDGEFWGLISESYFEGDTQHIWMDYTHESHFPYEEFIVNTSTNDNGDDKVSTPGFETIVFLTVIILAIFHYKKRRYK
jgi:hypothetical protein